jgi:hypothetical protein
MKQTGNGTDWLTAIAKKADVDISRVEEILTARRIYASPVIASPRRLLLKAITFSGEKDAVVDAGSFEFSWNDLDRGLWGMVTESNLKGKSSVIEVVRWLLRGRASNNFQEDVRRWILRASLRFQIDEEVYEVGVETTGQTTGSLVRIKGDKEHTLATFANDSAFESVMSEFFLREFGLTSLASWRDSPNTEGGKAVFHGWATLSGVMFIGTDYSSLLGDLPPQSGVPIRLMQMYLGLPWISTLAAAKAAQSEVSSEHAAIERRRTASSEIRKERVNKITSELDDRRLELATTPSDVDLKIALAARSAELSQLRNDERALEERRNREEKGVVEAEMAYAEDRRDLQAHLDAQSAGVIFRRLDPSCCPRCDAEIGESRREQEKTNHSCSVCGKEISSDSNVQQIRDELDQRVEASKSALENAKDEQLKLTASLETVRARIEDVDTQISSLTLKLASFGVRSALELQIAVLEGRLDEARYDVQPDVISLDEIAVLNAAVSVTDNLVKEVQVDLLEAISRQLVVYAKRFGMEALSEADLKGNMNLLLVKGGQNTSYSKVTEGEKLRLKVATVLAMISVAEAKGVGRHPGLLMIDSPGAQEVSPQDLEELIGGLEEVSKEFKHLQVFIAALASPAIKNHVSLERLKHAEGDAPLW